MWAESATVQRFSDISDAPCGWQVTGLGPSPGGNFLAHLFTIYIRIFPLLIYPISFFKWADIFQFYVPLCFFLKSSSTLPPPPQTKKVYLPTARTNKWTPWPLNCGRKCISAFDYLPSVSNMLRISQRHSSKAPRMGKYAYAYMLEYHRLAQALQLTYQVLEISSLWWIVHFHVQGR